jgi:zinc transport system substrate-binding protein
MLAIRNADLFIYTGKDMEPWAQAIITGMNNITVVDCSENITLLSPRCDNLAHGADPHIWLNPDNAVQMIENIFAAISQKDPENHDFYRNNADEYIQKLRNLDENFRYAIENAERDTVVFGGRFAYIYFLAHYDLDYITAYDSCAAHAEPGAAQIARVKNFIRANNIPVIYHEELSNPRIARSIALETGIEYMQFSTAHNITKQEFDDGVTFLDIMRANLENLKKGLG